MVSLGQSAGCQKDKRCVLEVSARPAKAAMRRYENSSNPLENSEGLRLKKIGWESLHLKSKAPHLSLYLPTIKGRFPLLTAVVSFTRSDIPPVYSQRVSWLLCSFQQTAGLWEGAASVTGRQLQNDS